MTPPTNAGGSQDKNYQILEEDPAPGSALFRMARELVRGTQVEQDLVVNEAVETAMLTQYLDELRTVNLAQGAGGRGGGGGRGGRGVGGRGGDGLGGPGLGPGFGGRGGGPDIKELNLKAFLTRKTTAESAAAMVKTSRLRDPDVRRSLNAKEALAKSDDPLIRLALMLEAPSDKIRKEYEDTIGSLEASAAEKIAAYRFRFIRRRGLSGAGLLHASPFLRRREGIYRSAWHARAFRRHLQRTLLPQE